MSNTIFARYDVYQDIGIEWLGEVPAHWEGKRIKEICEVNKSTLSEKTASNYEFEYVDIGSVTYGNKGYITEKMTFDTAPSRAKRIVKKGDTIISTVRTYLKAIASIENDVSDLIVSTGFAVISPKKQIVHKYCSYLLISEFIIDKICALSKGVSYPATTATVIGDLFFPIPPIPEQTIIATYIDTKTTQIDRKVDLLSQKAVQYGKLKQSLINETVTRGLDKTVAMKDSGVDWIGKVPSHWKIVRNKDIFKERGALSISGDETLLTVSHITGVTRRTEKNVNMFMAETMEGYKHCEKGDLIINTMWAWMGALGTAKEDGICSPAYGVYKPKKYQPYNPRYFDYWHC